jgi:hypothetical protein
MELRKRWGPSGGGLQRELVAAVETHAAGLERVGSAFDGHAGGEDVFETRGYEFVALKKRP